METEDIISLSADSPENGGEGNGHNQRARESSYLNGIEEVKEAGKLPKSSGDNADGHNKLLSASGNCNNMRDDPPSLGISSEPTETIAVNGKETPFLPLHADNGSLAVKDETFLSNHKEDEFPLSVLEIGASSLSGFKRPRVTLDKEQPFVKVTYKSLTRDSKKKLKQLLQQWSQWHAKHSFSSPESGKVLESGEDTYYPAIQVGLDKPSAVDYAAKWFELGGFCAGKKQSGKRISYSHTFATMSDGYGISKPPRQ